MVDLAERVHKGSMLLDEKLPDWFMRIDMGILQMHRSDRCICGQAYGSYPMGREALGIPEGGGEEYGIQASNELYPELEELWIREIELRKLLAASPVSNEQKELIDV